MNFDDLKVIWDSQSNETLYAINQHALRRQLRKESRVIKRCVVFFDFAVMLVSFGMSLMMLVEPIFQRRDYHQLPGAVILFAVAVYAFAGIGNRLRREKAFDATLLGDLDRAISQLEFQIHRLGTLVWWFIVPFSVTTLISFTFLYDSKPAWLWIAFAFCMVFTVWENRREIRNKLLPKKQELESLRKTLIDQDTQGE